mmetsp:Transcript_16277/g.33507  ORF Transcript_16277/g.33507 Transcript_16277/m.33507 type:complete len:330 (-) Transcript_16277:30-1019(-)
MHHWRVGVLPWRASKFKSVVFQEALRFAAATHSFRSLSAAEMLGGREGDWSDGSDGRQEVAYFLDEARQVGVITLDAAERRNAFTRRMAKQWRALVDDIEADLRRPLSKTKPRALVIRGKGLSFCAGGHLGMLRDIAKNEDVSENGRVLTELYSSFLSIRRLGVPLVGALHGHCVGGGAGIAMGCCDVRVADRGTLLRFNFVKDLGIHPGMGTTRLLPELVGQSAAMQLLFQLRSREETLALLESLGVVRVVGGDNGGDGGRAAFEAAMEVAAGLARANPAAMRSLLQTTRASPQKMQALEKVLEEEGREQARTFASPECSFQKENAKL